MKQALTIFLKNNIAKIALTSIVVSVVLSFYTTLFAGSRPLEMWQSVQNFETEWQRFVNAKALWEQKRPYRYQLDVASTVNTKSLLCWIDYITYENAQIVLIEPTLSSQFGCQEYGQSITMENMFDRIEEDLLTGPYLVRTEVSYDADWGYVTFYHHADLNCLRQMKKADGCIWSYSFKDLKILQMQP